MSNLNPEQKRLLKENLEKLSEAAKKIADIVEETGYELTTAPEYMTDFEDFSYEVMSVVNEEIEILDEVEVTVDDEKVELKTEVEIDNTVVEIVAKSSINEGEKDVG